MRNALRVFLTTTLFSLLALAQQAAACYENGSVKICKGDQVCFVRENTHWLGKADEVFTNGRVKIEFSKRVSIENYYGRHLFWRETSHTTLRDASEISPAVSSNGGIRDGSCVSFDMRGRTYTGKATHVFANGRVRVLTDSNSLMYPLISENKVGVATQCTR